MAICIPFYNDYSKLVNCQARMHVVCRCYEIQCVSGSVVGNYTADDLPMFLTVAAANPPYTWNFTTAHIPLDDNNDTFPGNSGASENQLTVQCWNETVRSRVWLPDSCSQLVCVCILCTIITISCSFCQMRQRCRVANHATQGVS